ncbi:MAG: GUN4 domain-containing protein [Chroococcus sp. CMT-3BRIN-NPC107]|nr:GUN4 domain-containing protein [Chroococcus sp. CMT-3BRIN-NPC107]
MKEQQIESNKQIVEKLAEVKKQLSEKQSQTQQSLQLDEFNAFKAELSQSLSDLQLKISKLAAKAGLVSSATGVDYSLLDNLLAAENWQKADEETRLLMWKISNRGALGSRFLDDGDIKKFPWQDIHIINQLWVEYSRGHFGFSVQKQIWQTVEVPSHRNFEAEKSLSRRVGWRVNDDWLSYSEFTFNLNAAKGHLPSTLHLLGRESGRVEHRMKLFFSHRTDL